MENKVKIVTLLNAKPAFDKLVASELKPVNSFRIARMIKAIGDELEVFNEKRNELIMKYGEEKKDKEGELERMRDGSAVFFVPEKSKNFPKYAEELQEILEAEINLNTDKLPLSVLDEITLTPGEANLLEPFFNFGE